MSSLLTPCLLCWRVGGFRPLDLESSLLSATGTFFVNDDVIVAPTSVLGVFDYSIQPPFVPDDGSVVRFQLDVVNAAGLTTSVSQEFLFDQSSPVCLDVAYVVDPHYPTVLLPNDDGTVTITATTDCWDLESGVADVVFAVGTYTAGRDVLTQCVVIAPGSTTLHGSATFVPVPATTYYATFEASNSVGFNTANFATTGLLYTTAPPISQPQRFGQSDIIGLHNTYSNTASSTVYTLDFVFHDPIAQVTGGTVTLALCPNASVSECIVGQTEVGAGVVFGCWRCPHFSASQPPPYWSDCTCGLCTLPLGRHGHCFFGATLSGVGPKPSRGRVGRLCVAVAGGRR